MTKTGMVVDGDSVCPYCSKLIMDHDITKFCECFSKVTGIGKIKEAKGE